MAAILDERPDTILKEN